MRLFEIDSTPIILSPPKKAPGVKSVAKGLGLMEIAKQPLPVENQEIPFQDELQDGIAEIETLIKRYKDG